MPRLPRDRTLMPDRVSPAPDNTAVRTALWRALHVLVDPPPHVFDGTMGLKLAAPEEGWRERPDMSAFTRPFRASILARARFIEDLVEEQARHGIGSDVIRGPVHEIAGISELRTMGCGLRDRKGF